ncbi:Alpha/beta hydrolase family protein [Maioricimonas rarisocia]|uniref:Alpha/beta hydrolase family protein n=1 Tax=Maioricimonas rarisocia TaxID=2528026 RepID=A0A517Z037_9PLAN|nr:alpha/beta fold hydrolase [Maioricimonas rarisocia]QDU35803.1 Alpha/beta hydrolase family protein [Maioricimonas rarisocia]
MSGADMSRARRLLLARFVPAVLMLLPCGLSAADQPMEDQAVPMSSTAEEQPTRWNMPLPTLGGRQFWGDVAFSHGWRIQHNVLTDKYRLLDPNDIRQAWGSFEDCQKRLDQVRTEQQWEPMTGTAVIFIHGIVRSSKSFGAMPKALAEAGYTVVGFDYPSTRVPIAESAEYFHKLLQSLDGVDEIHVVAHSMGGLVVRAWLAEHEDPRIDRMVMLGVPNNGARMANLLRDWTLFKAVFGPAGQQLVEDPEGVLEKLPVPKFEYAIVAGSRGTEKGFNPLIPGDDDGTVSVDSTRLVGAVDFMTVPVLHTFLPRDRRVIEAVKRFFKTGTLHADGERRPVVEVEEEPAPAGGE